MAGTVALSAGPATGQNRAGSLRSRIEGQKDRERALSGALGRLRRLERTTTREVAILQRRVAAVQAELAQAQAILQYTVTRREHQRNRALRLRARLAQSRAKLAEILRERYTGAKPDIVTVVLHSDGFASLLETVDFLKRVQHQDQRILSTVRHARVDAIAQRRVLSALAIKRRRAADAVHRRSDALATIAAVLQARRAALARARAVRSIALRNTRSSRRHAERALTKLLKERNRAINQVGPGGPWTIPWPIVQCESGGQNLPPNAAGASGYYQFLPDTWRGLGGSTPAAYLASKAEQDRLAAQLWDGGNGAGNWVCSALVGSI
ncbi:MAG TPA: transglycosylase family protein [Solirubrobacteraceae bacterium]